MNFIQLSTTEADSFSFDKLIDTCCNLEYRNIGYAQANLCKEHNGNIVRSAGVFRNPPQYFEPIHVDLLELIIDKSIDLCGSHKSKYNSALFEVYEPRYRTMSYHSDMGLDLDDISHDEICVYTCYEKPNNPNRKFEYFDKNSPTDRKEILLTNQSLLFFNKEFNGTFKHAIKLTGSSETTCCLYNNSRAIIITFRSSKNPNRRDLVFAATEEEKNEIYNLKYLENNTIGKFDWPIINYTLSIGDLSEPIYNCKRREAVLKSIDFNKHMIQNIHGLGVLCLDLFLYPENIFENVENAHTFCDLRESNKDSIAFRKGVYLSNVTREENENLRYNLLRCSTNFENPTECFKPIDKKIINVLNDISLKVFKDPAEFNHVLAQIYYNKIDSNRRAVIKAHTDKTKDMPDNGLIAFCTFYNFLQESKFVKRDLDENGNYNFFYQKNGKNKQSILSTLHFKLKKDVEKKSNEFSPFPSEFTVTLYPNSAFIIPLSTNRLYTHEIHPSSAPIDLLPLRLGYVVRCSNQEAIYNKYGEIKLLINGVEENLLRPGEYELKLIRDLYLFENTSASHLHYPVFIKKYSMNNGDYIKPI